jgi:hypothetical protein
MRPNYEGRALLKWPGNWYVSGHWPGTELGLLLGRRFRTAVAVAAICSVSANALAAGAICAAPQEIEAMHAEEVKQGLMVAALSCEETMRYNEFITAFQPSLQATDRDLQRFFRRTEGRGGTAAYHAFKTMLANAASRRSIAHITNYCNGAAEIFQTALNGGQVSLAAFLTTQPTYEIPQYDVCENIPIIAEDAEPPAVAIVPRMKPEMIIGPARGLVLRTSLGFNPETY